MDVRTILLICFGLSSAIIGVYVFLGKHTSNHRKHPCADKIVYKDVCEANRDCIETKIDGLKELLETRFDGLEDLIKNGGGRT